jgi:hypothetical protein
LKKYLASFAVGNEKVTVQEDCVIHEPVLDAEIAVVVALSPPAIPNLFVVILLAQSSYCFCGTSSVPMSGVNDEVYLIVLPSAT